MATEKRCKNCRFYDKSKTSIFGGWCLLGCHLHDNKQTSYGTDPEDHCLDWEDKHGN